MSVLRSIPSSRVWRPPPGAATAAAFLTSIKARKRLPDLSRKLRESERGE